ncbi:protection of telomeres protein 1-like [Saccoglossus kowalevskii]|uniref:Protection of telomeres protein 1 n=1 Tax=Saccoglossus kowalevskii TaxID=10224 RepID=A0ABM0MYM7_SACKO|nr:PREDICTED: uncharacterized protein LOC102808082 [Saccoglossus kowalevskii]
MESEEECLAFVPESLKCFLKEIFVDIGVKLASIGQAIIQASHPRVLLAPLQIGLAVQLHHHFASRFLIDSLHRHGFCSSYLDTQRFGQNAAIYQGTDIPNFSSEFVQYAADNVDHNIRTLDGNDTFHGMGIIATVTPGTKQTNCIPRENVSPKDISTTGHIQIQFHVVEGQGIAEVKYKDTVSKTAEDPTANLEIIWKTSLLFGPSRPAWSGMMQFVHHGNHPGKSSVGSVETRWPMQKVKNITRLKMIIKDNDDIGVNNKINVFFVNEIAERCENLHKMDIIIINNALVEKSPTFFSDHGHKFQLLIDAKKVKTKIKFQKASSYPPDSPITTSPRCKPKVRTYKYIPLNELKATNSVDVYGVVKFFKPAFKTRGTDYCMMVTIVDPSLEQNANGLKCVLFTKEQEMLPHVQAIGDIVRLHRIKIQKYNDELQGVRTHGFSSITFSGNIGAPIEPRTGCASYTLNDDDREQVRALRLWASKQSNLRTSTVKCTFADVIVGQFFDVVCQVVGLKLMEENCCVLFKVWDGTTCQSQVHCVDTSDDQVKWANDEIKTKSERFLLDVCCYDNHMEAASNVKPGQFVLIHNLHAARHKEENSLNISSVIEFSLHHGTAYGRGLTVLTSDSWEAQQVKRTMEISTAAQNTVTDVGRNPRPGKHNVVDDVITIVDSDDDMNQVNDSVQSQMVIIDDEVFIRTKRKKQSNPLTPNNPAPIIDLDPSSSSVELLVPNKKSGAQVHSEKSTNQNSLVELPTNQKRWMQESASVITHHHHISPVRLRDVTCHAVPYKFRIRAMVLSYFPRKVIDFVHLQCTKCRYSCPVPDPQSFESPSKRQSERLQSKTSSDEECIKDTSRRVTRSSRQDNPTLHSPIRTSPRIAACDNKKLPNGLENEVPSIRRSPRKRSLNACEGTSPKRSSKPSKQVSPKSSKQSTPKPSKQGTSKSSKQPQPGMPKKSESSKKTKEDFIHSSSSLPPPPLILACTVGDIPFYRCPKCEMNKDDIRLTDTPDTELEFRDTNKQKPKSSMYTRFKYSSTVHRVSILQYMYFFHLLMSDGTDKIEVLVGKENAETLFSNIPPTNLYKDTESQSLLEDLMYLLCPESLEEIPSDAAKNRQWMECCIMSYNVKIRHETRKKYQMFDTTLALNVGC